MPYIYTNDEYADMLAIFYEVSKITLKSSRLYFERYSEENSPHEIPLLAPIKFYVKQVNINIKAKNLKT